MLHYVDFVESILLPTFNTGLHYLILLSVPGSPRLTMIRDPSKTEMTDNHTPNIHTSLFQTIESIVDWCISTWQKGISQKAWPEAKIWRHSSSVPNCHHNGEHEAAWPAILLTRRGPVVILPLSLIQSHGRLHCSRYISRLRTQTKEDERQKTNKRLVNMLIIIPYPCRKKWNISTTRRS